MSHNKYFINVHGYRGYRKLLAYPEKLQNITVLDLQLPFKHEDIQWVPLCLALKQNSHASESKLFMAVCVPSQLLDKVFRYM